MQAAEVDALPPVVPKKAGKPSLIFSLIKEKPCSSIFYGLVALFFLVLVVSGNPVYATMFGFMYFCLFYAWENIVRLAWLETEVERKAPMPCCNTEKIVVTREMFCYSAWVLYLLIAFTSLTFSSALSGTEPNAYSSFSYSILGSLGALFLSVTTVDIVDALRRVSMKCGLCKKYLSTINDKQIYQIKSMLSIAACIIFSTLALANGYNEGWTMRLEIPIKRLPPCLDGFKIGLLSDVHGGVLIGKTGISKHVAAMNKESLDIMILSGDIADGSPKIVSGALQPIVDDLKTKFGTYFSTGNHEYMHGTGTGEEQGAAWEEWWKSQGIVVLHNNITAVPSLSNGGPYSSKCNETFDLIGVPDLGHGPKLKETLAHADQSRAKILIAHQPLEIIKAAKENVDLQLSGHTHAGHFFPLHIGISLSNRGYLHGLDKMEDTYIYTSAGTTGWGPRTRLWSFNERTVITLRNDMGNSAPSDVYRTSLSIAVGLSAFMFLACCSGCINSILLPSVRNTKTFLDKSYKK
jgi:predicted MPP superfamily phosphohydrolase